MKRERFKSLVNALLLDTNYKLIKEFKRINWYDLPRLLNDDYELFIKAQSLYKKHFNLTLVDTVLNPEYIIK